jgi:hypothetical protein
MEKGVTAKIKGASQGAGIDFCECLVPDLPVARAIPAVLVLFEMQPHQSSKLFEEESPCLSSCYENLHLLHKPSPRHPHKARV